MKGTFGVLFFILFFVSCKQKITKEDLNLINGYWEIEKVVFETGKDKEYGLNETYDYFIIHNNKTGYRKKVMPQLNGTFIVNAEKETVSIRFHADKVYLDYATPYMKWTEELVAISQEKLVFMNTKKEEYHYKRATPINLLGNGKEIK